MSTERKGTEIYVGLFLLFGLAFIAIMVIRFGGIGQGFEKNYEITVEFPNASGLVKGAPVLLAGASIGRVLEEPKLIVRNGFGVSVRVAIRDNVMLPRDSTIVVDQSGLLGDCYVDVLPPEKIDPKNVIAPGETFIGTNKPGLGALQQKGAIVLSKLAEEIDELKDLTVSLNQKLLSEQNLKNLSQTLDHLRTTSDNLSVASAKLDGILKKGDDAMDSAKKTFDSANQAATDLRAAMVDVRKLSDSVNKTLDSAKGMVDTGTRLLKRAEQGDGALGVLLTDKETANNLKSFAANLKRSGPVFYKDRAESSAPPAPAATPAPRRR